jgi:hypothetical protein
MIEIKLSDGVDCSSLLMCLVQEEAEDADALP